MIVLKEYSSGDFNLGKVIGVVTPKLDVPDKYDSGLGGYMVIVPYVYNILTDVDDEEYPFHVGMANHYMSPEVREAWYDHGFAGQVFPDVVTRKRVFQLINAKNLTSEQKDYVKRTVKAEIGFDE